MLIKDYILVFFVFFEALKTRIKDPSQDINKIALDNLSRLSKLGGTNE